MTTVEVRVPNVGSANGNGKIDKDKLGRPTEGIGLLRGAPMWFGPPKFGDAAFRVAGEPVLIDIALRFEPKSHLGWHASHGNLTKSNAEFLVRTPWASKTV